MVERRLAENSALLSVFVIITATITAVNCFAQKTCCTHPYALPMVCIMYPMSRSRVYVATVKKKKTKA